MSNFYFLKARRSNLVFVDVNSAENCPVLNGTMSMRKSTDTQYHKIKEIALITIYTATSTVR